VTGLGTLRPPHYHSLPSTPYQVSPWEGTSMSCHPPPITGRGGTGGGGGGILPENDTGGRGLYNKQQGVFHIADQFFPIGSASSGQNERNVQGQEPLKERNGTPADYTPATCFYSQKTRADGHYRFQAMPCSLQRTHSESYHLEPMPRSWRTSHPFFT
jgi:hypothetical protein